MTSALRKILFTVSVLTTSLVSSFAWACPVCAQGRDGGWLYNAALAAMVFAPWAIALSVGLWIRRGNRPAALDESEVSVTR